MEMGGHSTSHYTTTTAAAYNHNNTTTTTTDHSNARLPIGMAMAAAAVEDGQDEEDAAVDAITRIINDADDHALAPHHLDSPAFLPHPPPPQRRPRGFAATAAAAKPGRKEREKEKERTKLRERHRRAITSRMLAGLRQYGNFNLPARADMNDVLAALAREAGWSVDPDGTTYRPSPSPLLAQFPVRSVESPLSSAVLPSIRTSFDSDAAVHRVVDDTLSPASLDSVVVSDRDAKDKYVSAALLDSPDCLESDPLMSDVQSGENDNIFSSSPHIPVYVMLPAGTINKFCQLVDPEGLNQELSDLKSLNVDGVVVDCWWGIVENWSPQKYLWSGYRDLFTIIRQSKLRIQVVMAFHECQQHESGEAMISLPKWVLDIGNENQDIFFTDREGRINTECLSWGIDKERALKGRTGIEAYFDFMRSFRSEFDDLFAEGLISAVEIGLGPSGELKYPSFPERMGWRYPGVGEFQCYDKYMQQSLRRAAKLRGHTFWARGPDNAGQYNSMPDETGFFCNRGDYDSYYGRFFLSWYTRTLIDHADHVLSLATLAFEDIEIVVKIPAVFWWYQTCSHAAELTAGIYNPVNHDGYSPIFEVIQKYSATVKFVCSGLPMSFSEIKASADLEALCWQVINCAWDRGLSIAGQNVLPCYDRASFSKMVEMAKPKNHPDKRYLSFYAYQQHSPGMMQKGMCIPAFDYFVKCMHGDIPVDQMSM